MKHTKRGLVLFVLVLFTVFIPFTALARAGGGGGGNGGGGGGGAHGGSAGTYGGSRHYSPLSDAVGYIWFGSLAFGGAIVYFVRVCMKSAKAKKAMENLSKADGSWNYSDFRSRIRTIFYTVQDAWTQRNQDIAKDCLSQSLYAAYTSKSEWMTCQHEKNILKNIHLIDALPIDAEDYEGDANDRIWVYIKARMVDYTIDDQTMEFKSGSKLSKSFVEYWKLIKENGSWVLDEIKQKDEMKLDSF